MLTTECIPFGTARMAPASLPAGIRASKGTTLSILYPVLGNSISAMMATSTSQSNCRGEAILTTECIPFGTARMAYLREQGLVRRRRRNLWIYAILHRRKKWKRIDHRLGTVVWPIWHCIPFQSEALN